MRPYLFLDVDGVLALKHAPSEAFEFHDVQDFAGESHELFLNPSHGLLIRRLAADYDIVWATGWEHDAPRVLQPLLNLPPFPHIRFTQRPSRDVFLNKLTDLVTFAGPRNFAWLDDSISSDDRRLVSFLPNDTMLIAPDPATGVTERHISQLESFVQRVKAVRPTETLQQRPPAGLE